LAIPIATGLNYLRRSCRFFLELSISLKGFFSIDGLSLRTGVRLAMYENYERWLLRLSRGVCFAPCVFWVIIRLLWAWAKTAEFNCYCCFIFGVSVTCLRYP
jgi:hypothetical protein